jgi:hypothetical protein
LFCLVLLSASVAVERYPGLIPCPACRFLYYLDTREAGGESLTVWDRITAGFVLTGYTNKKARNASERPGLVSAAKASI